MTEDDVRQFLETHLRTKLLATGRPVPATFGDDFDMMLSGAIDSLGFLELTIAISEHFGTEVDFESADPESMTVIGPLSKFVAERIGTK